MNRNDFPQNMRSTGAADIRLSIAGKEYVFPADLCYRDIVQRVAQEDASVVPGEVLLVLENNRLRELYREPVPGAQVSFVTCADKTGWSSYRRGLLLMMLKAVDEISGHDSDYAVKVHFSIHHSFYCTLAKEELATDEFLEKVSAYMHDLCARKLPIKKRTVGTEEAMRIFAQKGLRDKEQLFRYRMSSFANLYELDGFVDYYFGYMPDNTAQLSEFALRRFENGFDLLMTAGKDKEKGIEEMMQPLVSRKKVFDIQMGSKVWGGRIGLQDVGDLNDRIVNEGSKQLVLVQEAYHEQRIAEIATKIASDPQKRFVMIAGPSSSGKTTFSHRLSAQLAVHGITPHPIPVDDYFVDREKTPLNPDGTYNFECLEAIEIKQFNEDMLALLEGREVELPTFNFKTGKREYKGKKLRLGENDIMVIEGIHCLNDALSYALPAQNKFKIYISALTQLSVDEHDPIPTTDGRLLRRIVRDARTRGTSAAGTIAMWPSVRNGEENYIFPFQDSADVMFNSALIYELGVLKIYAEPLLFGIDRSSPEYVEAKRLLKFLDYFVPISAENIPVNSLVREFIGGSCFDV